MKIIKKIKLFTLLLILLVITTISSINFEKRNKKLTEENPETNIIVSLTSNKDSISSNNAIENKIIPNKEINKEGIQKSNTASNENGSISASTVISNDYLVDDFILSSTFQSHTLIQGLLSSSGMFISCNNEFKVTAEKTRFARSEELQITKVSGEEDVYNIKSVASNTYFSIDINDKNAIVDLPKKKFFSLETVQKEKVKENDKEIDKKEDNLPSFDCKDKAISERSKIKIKRFHNNAYIETKYGFVSFNGKITTFTKFLSVDNYISGAFNFPEELKPNEFIPKELCNDLECKKVNFKFKECDKYLTATEIASDTLTTLTIQSYKGGLLNISQGAFYITISINKELVFLQTQTQFGLFSLHKVPSADATLREIVVKGYGDKYLSCKNDKIYLSDSINIYTKIGY